MPNRVGSSDEGDQIDGAFRTESGAASSDGFETAEYADGPSKRPALGIASMCEPDRGKFGMGSFPAGKRVTGGIFVDG
jgi:hypothetical protein